MSQPAISVERLVKVYGRAAGAVRAVDDLSFEVTPGSIFGLLGPNGAGKTTTLKILTTLVQPTSGRASVLGIDVVRRPLDVRRRLVAVIQDQAVELFLSVRDNLLTFARFHGITSAEARERADRVMEQFGLVADAGRKVMDLSGGFRRRVQVGKVLMVDTPLVFLDEFSTGMDPILKRAVMDRLRAEAARGRTIVLTTQILTEAEELCNDILILNRGRELARGDLHSLKLLSEGVYELSMTFDRLPPDIESRALSWNPVRIRTTHNTIELTLKEREPMVLELARQLSELGRVLRIEVSGASLEDVFIELTGRTS